jgi:hypothetical protein
LKTSSENPSPLIVTAPPPYPILLGLRSVMIAEPKLCPGNKDMNIGLIIKIINVTYSPRYREPMYDGKSHLYVERLERFCTIFR